MEVHKPEGRVLSVACGHFRELELLRGSRLAFVGLDQDAASLDRVREDYGAGFNLELFHAGVRHLLSQRVSLGSFDLIFASGLYDYLNSALARRLTAVLFNHLEPGGRLIVGNFVPGIRDVGYMESYMAWHLVFRSPAEMLQLAEEIPNEPASQKQVFVEDSGCIAFLSVDKVACMAG